MIEPHAIYQPSNSSIKSPQILELSGIGRRDVLQSIKVDVKIDLPGVGENVQEHASFIVNYEIDSEKLYNVLNMIGGST